MQDTLLATYKADKVSDSLAVPYHISATERYLKVRLAFIARGSSLHAGCVDNQIAMANARSALLGKWHGQKARALVGRIELASGVLE